MSEPPGSDVQADSTCGAGVSILPVDHKMIIQKIVLNEMFGEKIDESFIGFDEIEVVLNSIIE